MPDQTQHASPHPLNVLGEVPVTVYGSDCNHDDQFRISVRQHLGLGSELGASRAIEMVAEEREHPGPSDPPAPLRRVIDMDSERLMALSAANCEFRLASPASCAKDMDVDNQPGHPDLSELDLIDAGSTIVPVSEVLYPPKLRRFTLVSFWDDSAVFSNSVGIFEAVSYQWGTAPEPSPRPSTVVFLDHARSSDNDWLITSCPSGLPVDELLELPRWDINHTLWGWVDGPDKGAEDLTTEASLFQPEINPFAMTKAFISEYLNNPICLKSRRHELASFRPKIDERHLAIDAYELEPAAIGRPRSSRVTSSSCKHHMGFGCSRPPMHLDNDKHSTSWATLCALPGRHGLCEFCTVEKDLGGEIRQAWDLSIASVDLDRRQGRRRAGSAQAASADAGRLPSEDSHGWKEGDAGPARVSDFQIILTWTARLINAAYNWVCCTSEKESRWFQQGLLLSHV